MKRAALDVVSLTAALCLGALSSAEASPASPNDCTARVLHAEELPYAPMGYWLVKVTLEVTPPNGPRFVRTRLDNIPLRKSSPRRGDTYRLSCSSVGGLGY